MKCPLCGREVAQLRSGVRNGQYLSDRCDNCLENGTQVSDFSRKYERDRQREDYRKDIIQPGDEEFARAYGVDAAREKGWSERDIRKHG